MQLHGLRPCFPSRCAFQTRVLRATCVLIFGGACASQALAQNATSPDGSQVYMQSGCFVCHGEMGDGGAGPRFRGDPFLGITDYVVAQISLGRGIMPSFADKLNDQQIAAVATYVRNSWGNHFGEVKPEQVAQLRKQIQTEQIQIGSSQPGQRSPANPPADSQKRD